MQNPPPPPPPPSGGQPPTGTPPSQPPYMAPPGQPPMMPPGGGGAIALPSNLASPGLRIVGGLIDVVILIVINAIIAAILQKAQTVAGLIGFIIDVGYCTYFWSQRGQTIGMMVFGFRVRDLSTGQYPTTGKAVLRAIVWNLEVGFTICIIGAIGWLWQLWDPQRQAIHDKVGGTIVTTS